MPVLWRETSKSSASLGAVAETVTVLSQAQGDFETRFKNNIFSLWLLLDYGSWLRVCIFSGQLLLVFEGGSGPFVAHQGAVTVAFSGLKVFTLI